MRSRGIGVGRVIDLHGSSPHERERLALLRLFSAHPHCFGLTASAAGRSAGASIGPAAYESIEQIGYDAARNVLEATVRLARPLPELGDPCVRDALEYVRFFVDQGHGWENVGLAVFDPLELLGTVSPGARAGATLRHQVTLGFAPSVLGIAVTRFRVRAVVAWGARPPADAPDWRPPWGGAVEREVMLHPSRVRRAMGERERSVAERMRETGSAARKGRAGSLRRVARGWAARDR
jgi:hypothetical protein